MKKIGVGWQYEVYDLGNGRVRKIKHPKLFQYLFIQYQEIIKKEKRPFKKAFLDIQRVNRMEKESNAYIQKILPHIDSVFLGNPIFINKNNYEQNKVQILRNILDKISIEQGKTILEQYTKLIHLTWQYGFADAMYNFLGNNGINQNEELVQVDFGEILIDKESIKNNIISKRWLKTTSFVKMPENDLKDFYRQVMDREITVENLEKFWQAKISS